VGDVVQTYVHVKAVFNLKNEGELEGLPKFERKE